MSDRAGNCARALMLALALMLTGAPAQAAPDPAFLTWLAGLWPEAKAMGIGTATFDRAFQGVEPDLTLPDLVLPGRAQPQVKGQSEFTKTPQDYLDKAYLTKLANQGKALLTEHAATLDKIEQKIGVERSILIAIWGRETAFGTYKLPHYAIKALATEAYLGRRKESFRKELLFALKMLEDNVVTPDAMRSSWAGAMGLTQFLPSEYYESAVHLDGPGKPDIFTSIPDALASAAKQLKQKGWVTGLPWGYEVRRPPTASCLWEGPTNMRSVSDWAKAGFVRAGGQPFSGEQLKQQAYLLLPAGTYGPAFLATENFLVIKRYNPADLYALFVGHLADRARGGSDFEAAWASIPQLPSTDIEDMQRRLGSLGYDIQKVDGKAGVLTRSIVGAYQKANRLSIDCWPSEAVLKHMKSAAAQ